MNGWNKWIATAVLGVLIALIGLVWNSNKEDVVDLRKTKVDKVEFEYVKTDLAEIKAEQKEARKILTEIRIEVKK